ncbi:hypothetical protein VOLCADRAFT_100563 [Volvox carteri f. nagariensis]|uniref:Uncharacterized protein n=1 Tax=Volvox carteri f. nagariensis TaxID=3068 RepID=D8UKH8_VOLCA|nr:uncharacterized protein VOLCADRAFT_100563 [Volvox carteri f. nagariensis]EFJ39788.1 hypothetical protein VOLCADRAFT_100563 [Volvox carteri f. nagariensis]|eukprot:XP_002959165.1 hypothetical protein VOLCADRAFT_100563 [Volvox carteri f. nagariensis]
MSSGEVLLRLYDCIQEARSAHLNIKYLSWKYAYCIALHPIGEQLEFKDMTAEAPVSSKAVDIWDIVYKKEGAEPFCLSQALGSLVKKHIFKNYLITGAQEHVLRTCGSSYRTMDLDMKIAMVKAEMEKAPKPLPGQIGYKYGAKYFWPQRPWIDELKPMCLLQPCMGPSDLEAQGPTPPYLGLSNIMSCSNCYVQRLLREKENLAKSADEVKRQEDFQSQQQAAAAAALSPLTSSGAVDVGVAASNQQHTAAMPAATPTGAVDTAAVNSTETLDGRDGGHGSKGKNLGMLCQSASLGTGGAAVAAADAGGVTEGEVFNPVDATPTEEAASGSAARLSCQKASTFMVGASADNTAPTTTGGPAMDQGQPSIPGGPGAEFVKAGPIYLQVRQQLMTRAFARSGLEGKDGCHMAMHGPKRKNLGTLCQSASLGTGGAAVAAADAGGVTEGEVFNTVDATPTEEAASGSAARLSCQKASTFMVGASADNTAPTTTGGLAMDQGQPSIPGGPGAEFEKAGASSLQLRRQVMTRAMARSGLEGKDGCHMAMHGPKRKNLGTLCQSASLGTGGAAVAAADAGGVKEGEVFNPVDATPTEEAASGSAARLSCQKVSTFMMGASADNTAPITTSGPAMDRGQPSIPGGPGAEFEKAGASSLQLRRQVMTRALARSGLEGKDGCRPPKGKDLFPALAAELAGPAGGNKSRKRKRQHATVQEAAEKVARMNDDSMEDDSMDDEYITIENSVFSVDKAEDVPAALEKHGLAILQVNDLRNRKNVPSDEVEKAILFTQQNAAAVFQDIPRDAEGNFIPERDKSGRKTGILLSDFGTQQRRQVIINTDDPDQEDMLQVFRVVVELEVDIVQRAMNIPTLQPSSPALLMNTQSASQKPVSRQCWHIDLSEDQTGFVVIAAVQQCSLLVFPGSHNQVQEYWRLQKLLEMEKIGEATLKACLTSKFNSVKAVRINLDLGDILFMSGHTIHAGDRGIDKHPALRMHWYVTGMYWQTPHQTEQSAWFHSSVSSQ